MAEFSIGQWARKAGLDVEQVARGVTISMFNSVVDNTRVDTGRLKGNWQTSAGSPANGTMDRTDPSGAQVKSEVAARVEPGAVNYITNNLPYAPVWNERDAIIDRVVARTETLLRQEAEKARR